MYLKEYSIRQYGPLSDSGRRKLGMFNLFYGSNEDGKTLTIDAFLKMLFKKKIPDCFAEAQRVREMPEGYLIIESDKEYKIPEYGNITSILGIDASDFSRIFIIRDSEMAISREDRLYQNICASLSGIRTSEIDRLSARVNGLARLTPKGAMQNSDPYKFKDRYRKSLSLIEKINYVKQKFQDKKYLKLTSVIAFQNERIEDLKSKLQILRDVQKRDIFLQGQKTLEEWKGLNRKLKELKKYSRQDYERWQESLSDLNYLREEVRNTFLEADRVKDKLISCEEDYRVIEQRYNKLLESLENADDLLQPDIDLHKSRIILIEKYNFIASRGWFKVLIFISAALFILMSLFYENRNSWPYSFLQLLSLILTLGGSFFLFVLQWLKANNKGLEEKILFNAKLSGIQGRSAMEVGTILVRFEGELNSIESERQSYSGELDYLKRERRRIEDKLVALQNKVKLEEEESIMYQKLWGLPSCRDLFNKLEEKTLIESRLDSLSLLLENLFKPEKPFEDDNESLDHWQQSLTSLKKYEKSFPDINYDQKTAEYIEAELAELEIQRDKLLKVREGMMLDLRDLERDFNDLMQYDREEYFTCISLIELDKMTEILKKWKAEKDLDLRAARLNANILDRLKEEEEIKANLLFNEKSPLNEYIGKITGGRYVKVLFRGGVSPLGLVKNDGTELDPGQISGGTYDQLYFAIRISLGKQLLRGEKGFFILDDPFIKADKTRLKIMIEMLKELSLEGWQILYFSSKEEIKSLLQRSIDLGHVHEFSVGITEN